MDDKHQELLDRLAILKESIKARPSDLFFQAGIEMVDQMLPERFALQDQSQKARETLQQLQIQLSDYRNNNAIQLQELEILRRETHEELLKKQQIIAQRDRLRQRLDAIESTVHEAVVLVKATKSLREKFEILWDFLHVVFSSDSTALLGSPESAS